MNCHGPKPHFNPTVDYGTVTQLGNGHAVAHRFVDMLHGGVVVAGGGAKAHAGLGARRQAQPHRQHSHRVQPRDQGAGRRRCGIQLRQRVAGRVVRLEPHADAVTEELLAKVEFSVSPAICACAALDSWSSASVTGAPAVDQIEWNTENIETFGSGWAPNRVGSAMIDSRTAMAYLSPLDWFPVSARA